MNITQKNMGHEPRSTIDLQKYIAAMRKTIIPGMVFLDGPIQGWFFLMAQSSDTMAVPASAHGPGVIGQETIRSLWFGLWSGVQKNIVQFCFEPPNLVDYHDYLR